MNKISAKQSFIEELKNAIEKNIFVKLSLSGYTGNKNEELKNVYVKIVKIKAGIKLHFIYRYSKKDISKNLDFDQAYSEIDKLISHQFKIATILSISNDIVLERRNNKYILRYNKPSCTKVPDLKHDNIKKRVIGTQNSKKYLNLLSITDKSGNVRPKSQDKYRQINNYIELLKPVFKRFDKNRDIEIADMGSGKGYLSFALYDFLTNENFNKLKITGVECRKDMVDLCNKIAQEVGFDKLNFVNDNIQNYKIKKLDVLIALHACDTATDDAIAKGVNANAEIIIVAPCCQHQIRQEIEKNKPQNVFTPIIKHGIFLERQSELLTDSIRTLLLNYMGYKTKVVEFISDAHTHKNLMIIAEKTGTKQAKALNQIAEIKNMFGIKKHYLEIALGINDLN